MNPSNVRFSRSREKVYAERRSRVTRSRSRGSRGRPSRLTRSRSPLPQAPCPTTQECVTAGSRSRGSPILQRPARRSPRQVCSSSWRDRSPSRRARNPPPRASDSTGRARSRTRSLRSPSQHSRSPLQRARSPSIHQEQQDLGSSNLFNNMNVNLKDFMNFMCSFKPDYSEKLTFDKNMVPEFDPTVKNHRIENWITKVNECAQIYKWTDQQTSHFALPRLVGYAKRWYEGLKSINRTWVEWQECLKRAFPSETNFGALLSEMLARRYKLGDSLDEYYYEKMVLLNACDITGKKAVDCIIYGLDDRTLKASASSARFNHPEDLLGFLKDMCREHIDRSSKNKLQSTPNNSITCSYCKKVGHNFRQCRALLCYNCKQYGHKMQQCPQPTIKCEHCQKLGHKSEDCFSKNKLNNKNSSDKRVMVTETSGLSNRKFYKEAILNNNKRIMCFLDFGSDCSLVKENIIREHDLILEKGDLPVIKGIGETSLQPIGKTRFNIKIDYVEAPIEAYVVPSQQLHVPVLIGQNFTELPDVLVIKTSKSLEIINRSINFELPSIEHESNDSVKLIISEDIIVNKAGPVPCLAKDLNNNTIFIRGTYRHYENKEYWIQEGLYEVVNGKVFIIVVTPSSSLEFKRNTVLARGEKVGTAINNNKIANCFHVQTSYERIDRKDINLNSKLTRSEIDKVYDLIDKYRTTFANNLSELGCTNLTEMDIQLTDRRPVVYRPYRLCYKERETVQNMVDELIQNDIVEESSSPYASPILLVSKKGGGQRLCVDYRELNRRTVKDHFPLPLIEDQIDQLSGSKFFTSLDLTSGYYQIPLKPDCKYLTAFITPNGLYQFKRMPFGLVNAPSVFQRTITKALTLKTDTIDTENKIEKPALAYMDDILVVSKTFEEGLKKLEKTFQLLTQSKLTLNINKCHFFKTSVEYLGYEINAEGIRPGSAKIEAVRQFVGLTSYFRKFIQNFSIIARPLTNLTRKDCPWNWGDMEEQAFITLKTKLVDRPILALYNPKFITELHTDASKLGLAGILLQKEDECSPLKPIAFFSRKTTIDEQKFHAYDLETLAVIESLKRFRVYLLGNPFTIVTDCNALRATFTKRDLLPRIARWWLQLQEYDCNIVYRPNHSMTHVDALSRNPVIPSLPVDIDITLPRVLAITHEDWLLSLQLTDPQTISYT
ncbi:hypothetical protein ABMA27_007079 [Loxostege sticticalis]|uniref:RNA-directed DNA polymerase n=1 Tax=Loxostege sticticalis TaxID=481309 RepID=A0ABR3ILG2_LOXSC